MHKRVKDHDIVTILYSFISAILISFVINEDTPVQVKAESSNVKFNNSCRKGEKYSLENIGGEQGLYPPNGVGKS